MSPHSDAWDVDDVAGYEADSLHAPDTPGGSEPASPVEPQVTELELEPQALAAEATMELGQVDSLRASVAVRVQRQNA